MKMILKIIGILALIPLLYVVGVILLGQLTYYTPNEIENLSGDVETAKLSDSTFTAMIWNIGYGGLGKEMDFFFDDGKRVRPKKEWHEKYFNSIKQYVNENRVDFLLLQEVDKRSKRSYKTNEAEALFKTLGTPAVFATNYKVKYVPLDWTDPLGAVNSGLQSFSPKNTTSKRYQFPGSYGFPDRLFFLRRCFLEQEFNLVGTERKLYIINTHNSAYDDGTLKAEEMAYLKKHISALYEAGHYVLVGGDWNQMPPGFEGENVIPADYLSEWTWAYGPNVPTNRSLEKPYDGTNAQKIIDYFLLSPNLKANSVSTQDLQFESSDHQPVKLEFSLQ